MRARSKARELALQMLYQLDMVKIDPEQALEAATEGGPLPQEVRDFALQLTRGAAEKKEEIDEHLKSASMHWSIERMAIIDKNILRMAVYELKYISDIPYKVTINEAVELAKKFGGENSPAFVNGILDKVNREVDAQC